MDLTDFLIKKGYLKINNIIDAFKKIKRADFILDGIKNLSEENSALPIGYGQTISQPLTVAFMLELLSPKKGEKVLDVGFGSGWTTALLSHIVGDKGKVFAIEFIPELFEFGKKNVSKYNFNEKKIANFILGDGKDGYEKESPFDRILCSAEAKTVPISFKKQLKKGGRIVIPVKSSIFLLEKISENKFKEKEFYGFSFVPLV